MTETDSINADLTRRVVIDTAAMDWQPSPSPTVWRKRLCLSGAAESGKVTSIVRYEANSEFPSHPHPDGEEIFVLDGVFSDEDGDYPAGTYLLNPDGIGHAPYSREGCTLFVKLRQYAGADRVRLAVDTTTGEWEAGPARGTWFMPLYAQDGYPEKVRLTRFEAGSEPFPHGHPDGEEVLVIEGELRDEHGAYPKGTWVRSPAGSSHAPYSETGCRVLVRTGWAEPAA